MRDYSKRGFLLVLTMLFATALFYNVGATNRQERLNKAQLVSMPPGQAQLIMINYTIPGNEIQAQPVAETYQLWYSTAINLIDSKADVSKDAQISIKLIDVNGGVITPLKTYLCSAYNLFNRHPKRATNLNNRKYLMKDIGLYNGSRRWSRKLCSLSA